MAFDTGASGNTLLFAPEADSIISQLKPFQLRDIGSKQWQKQRENIEKLNVQAHLSVMHQGEEFVMESMCSHEKIGVVVHELLGVEVWKQHLWPALKEYIVKNRCTNILRPFLMLNYESTLTNFLEVLLFHKAACDAAHDVMLDLVDYCFRKLTSLLNSSTSSSSSSESATNTTSFIEKQFEERLKPIEFTTATTTLSLVRFITEYIQSLPLGVMNELLVENDMICLLVELLLVNPWSKKENGKILKFQDGQWGEVAPSNLLLLTKTESQLWLSLYNLLLDEECRKKYHYTANNKNVILKLLPFLNDVLIDQIPNLADLRNFLTSLQVHEPPAPTSIPSSFLIQQLPEIRQHLLKQNVQEVREHQEARVFPELTREDEETEDELTRLSNTFRHVQLEKPKCQTCHKANASKRCARCKKQWYCSRECQAAAWPTHKTTCTPSS